MYWKSVGGSSVCKIKLDDIDTKEVNWANYAIKWKTLGVKDMGKH